MNGIMVQWRRVLGRNPVFTTSWISYLKKINRPSFKFLILRHDCTNNTQLLGLLRQRKISSPCGNYFRNRKVLYKCLSEYFLSFFFFLVRGRGKLCSEESCLLPSVVWVQLPGQLLELAYPDVASTHLVTERKCHTAFFFRIE